MDGEWGGREQRSPAATTPARNDADVSHGARRRTRGRTETNPSTGRGRAGGILLRGRRRGAGAAAAGPRLPKRVESDSRGERGAGRSREARLPRRLLGGPPLFRGRRRVVHSLARGLLRGGVFKSEVYSQPPRSRRRYVDGGRRGGAASGESIWLGAATPRAAGRVESTTQHVRGGGIWGGGGGLDRASERGRHRPKWSRAGLPRRANQKRVFEHGDSRNGASTDSVVAASEWNRQLLLE